MTEPDNNLGFYLNHQELKKDLLKGRFEDYDSFADAIEECIQAQMHLCEKFRHLHCGAAEDQISAAIVQSLMTDGWDADMGRVRGGATDITVSYTADGLGELEWLAEAKRYTSNPDVHGGFMQLTTRYGNPLHDRNNRGGLLVYVQKKPGVLLEIAQEWSENLVDLLDDSSSIKIESVSDICPKAFSFSSLHKDPRKGFDIKVKHLFADLRHEPEDKAAKAKAKRAEAKASLANDGD